MLLESLVMSMYLSLCHAKLQKTQGAYDLFEGERLWDKTYMKVTTVKAASDKGLWMNSDNECMRPDAFVQLQ